MAAAFQPRLLRDPAQTPSKLFGVSDGEFDPMCPFGKRV